MMKPLSCLFFLFTGLMNFLQSHPPHDQTCKQKHGDVTCYLPDIYIHTHTYTAIIPSTCSQTWPWIVSTRLLANVSLWVKVLSLVWAVSTSATLFSNAKLNLSGRAKLSWRFWQNDKTEVYKLIWFLSIVLPAHCIHQEFKFCFWFLVLWLEMRIFLVSPGQVLFHCLVRKKNTHIPMI